MLENNVNHAFNFIASQHYSNTFRCLVISI